MTVKEALELALKESKLKSFDTCYEYPDFYVFSKDEVFDSSWAVYKKDKKVVPFNPLSIPLKVYRSGKQIDF